MVGVSTLSEIEAAAEALRPEEKEQLLRFLAARVHGTDTPSRKARVVRQDGDTLLEAAPGAPLMTPEVIRRMLEDWP
jgi:hypothetical protein